MSLSALLIVDDEKNTREALKKLLAADYDIYLAANIGEATESIKKQTFSVVLTDLRLGGNTSGMSVIQAAAKKHIPCIMMTAFGDIDTAVIAMRQGAYDFVTKPLDLQKLKIALKQACSDFQKRSLNTSLPGNVANSMTPIRPVKTNPSAPKTDITVIAAEHSPLRTVLERAKKIANNRANVLLYGETGTGKEIFAQTIHQQSDRKNFPLVAVHCASLSSTLLESELFGHEKGAFTGATERHIGKFEAAHHGTLFLDEIGEIDANTQIKLLRFLETKTFERIGSNEAICVDVRIVSATNKNLLQLVHEQKFREDLYYRLNVIELDLPPLRERPEDIPLLFRHYIQFFANENHISAPSIQETVFDKLKSYSWPGNVRELRNTCESIIALLPDGAKKITSNDLNEKFSH